MDRDGGGVEREGETEEWGRSQGGGQEKDAAEGVLLPLLTMPSALLSILGVLTPFILAAMWRDIYYLHWTIDENKTRDWEIPHCINCLLWKHEDLSSDS